MTRTPPLGCGPTAVKADVVRRCCCWLSGGGGKSWVAEDDEPAVAEVEAGRGERGCGSGVVPPIFALWFGVCVREAAADAVGRFW